MSETNSDYDSENSGSAEIKKYYKQSYIMKDTGRVYVYDDYKLTTFEFIDYVNYNPAYQVRNYIHIDHCPNVSFKIVPTCITKLEIINCDLERLNGLSQMYTLEELNLSGNNISDLSELENFHYLDVLNLSYNSIVDISLFGLDDQQECNFNLHVWGYLDLSCNRIINIDALKNQKDITELRIHDNYIQDFSPIKNLKYKVYYDENQQNLDEDQKIYQRKYLIVIRIKKNLEYISQKSRKISSSNANCKQLVLEKKGIIQQNFQQFMVQVALLFQQSEYFDLSCNQ
ncbi:leucine-rich_repeat domain-containing protein [Hexamita inflata]|uniref:Leucine-rich_repeat domain-containing protein n=1 Tax=Hexamita inflata TaxID=28002 RepID=A0ABP1H746_9EUKA